MKNELERYALWYDGYIEVPSVDVIKYSKYSRVCVDKLSDEIRQYNRFVENKILPKTEIGVLDISWNLPSKYLEIDIDRYVRERLVDISIDLEDDDILERITRSKFELSVFKTLNLYDLLRSMIYIVDRFTELGIVWGVGRGSSVASYILYLIGIHDIDSVMYELDFNEFLEL